MNTKNYLILATENHPLAHLIANTEWEILEVDPTSLYDLAPEDFENRDAVFDLSIMPTDYKLDLLGRLESFCECPVYSDTTINWGDYLLKHAPTIKGMFASAFYSPTNSCEVYAYDEAAFKEMSYFLSHLKLATQEVSSPGICFTYPRIISMIINEAYFALGENLANPEDIDVAMKFGVNYPKGPFEWAEKIGHQNLHSVLSELYRVTMDTRYKISKNLSIEVI